MVTRLAVILEDEGISDETATRIVRSLLYGAPTEAEAELRMQQEKRLMEVAMNQPTTEYLIRAWDAQHGARARKSV